MSSVSSRWGEKEMLEADLILPDGTSVHSAAPLALFSEVSLLVICLVCACFFINGDCV